MTRILPARLARLLRREDGVTIVEFGLIAPALMVLLLGALDIGHTLYMQSVLQGVVQKAARDGSLEDASGNDATYRTALDTEVESQLLTLNKNAKVSFDRRFYRTFSDAAAAKAEEFTDSASGPSKNGICDNGEPYVDANNNGVWDADGGDSVNNAGARDNIVYTVTISYARMFPLDKLVGGSGTTRLSAATVLANQPYGTQGHYTAPTVRNCS